MPDNLGNALLIGRQWLMIFGAAWLAVWSGHWAVYALAMMFIGTRMVVLGVLIHEAAHNHVFSKPSVNDVLSELFIGFPAGISIHLYRATHFWHHRALNTMEDPDYAFQRSDPDQHFPKSRAAFIWLTVRSALFVNFPPDGAVRREVVDAGAVPVHAACALAVPALGAHPVCRVGGDGARHSDRDRLPARCDHPVSSSRRCSGPIA